MLKSSAPTTQASCHKDLGASVGSKGGIGWEISAEVLYRAQVLVRDQEVIDLHTHPQKVAPHFVRRVAEWAADIPRDPLSNLRQGGVNVAVVTAVGDPLGTLWRGRGPWRGVEQQLNAARSEARAAGMSVLGSLALQPPLRSRGDDHRPRLFSVLRVPISSVIVLTGCGRPDTMVCVYSA